MESEGNKFMELIENLKVKQKSLKESILILEEEKNVLSKQVQLIAEQLQLKYRALNQCEKVIMDAEAKYEQFTNIYSKSQKLLANLDEDVMDADAFPIELETGKSSTSSYNNSNTTYRKVQTGTSK